MNNATKYIDSFEPLIDKYQLFLFDQFGVLHNGAKPYPGMAHVLDALKSRDKITAVISNSGKRSAINARRLENFGYGPDLISRIYTSGEIAWLQLKGLTKHYSAANPFKVYYLGNDSDRSALEGLPIVENQQPALADLIAIGGMGQLQRSEQEYQLLLKSAAGKRIPAYCTNPDLLSFDVNGALQPGPGRIAMIYESLGGRCEYFGKPHPEIYHHILSDVGVKADQTLCIGDSVKHDVLGANRAGCASLLVRTGIHAEMNESELQDLMKESCADADYILR